MRREYKDLVFRLLMQDKKNLLSLYTALNKTSYKNVDELRNLFYVAAQLGRVYRNKIIYSRKQINIPTPKSVFFYTGRKKRPENEVLKLSDAFECYERGHYFTRGGGVLLGSQEAQTYVESCWESA